jgi:DNA-binding transcriptional LysR family regulator
MKEDAAKSRTARARDRPGITSDSNLGWPLISTTWSFSITSPDMEGFCLPSAEAICRSFHQKLNLIGADWFPSIEVSSIDLIQTYVSAGFGIGLSVLAPQAPLFLPVRAVPLPQSVFPAVVVGALWRGRTSTLLQAFLHELRLKARQLA